MYYFLKACIWAGVSLETQNGWISQMYEVKPHWSLLYCQSFYFAAMTMTTVGYGDIIPKNPSEYIICIIIMFFSCGFFGFSLNTITEILIAISNNKKDVNLEIETIQGYMKKKKISFELQSRVKTYLKSLWKTGMRDSNLEDERKVISKLSDKLQKELLIEDKGQIFMDVPLFKKKFSKAFILKLIEKLKEIRLQPNESLCSDVLSKVCNFYYVHEGAIQIEFKKYVMIGSGKQQIKVSGSRHFGMFHLTKGQHFGTKYLFGKTENSRFSMKSLDFTIIYYITPEDIMSVAKSAEFIQSTDNEIFSMIRENVVLNNNFTNLEINCIACRNKNHDIFECGEYKFSPFKELVLKKHTYQNNQKRKFIVRKARSKFNSRKNKNKNDVEVEVEVEDQEINDSWIVSDEGEKIQPVDYHKIKQRGKLQKESLDKFYKSINIITQTSKPIETIKEKIIFEEFEKVHEYSEYFPKNNVYQILKNQRKLKIEKNNTSHRKAKLKDVIF